jgi:hypothetical protein
MGKINPMPKGPNPDKEEEDAFAKPLPLCPSLSSGAKEEDVWAALEKAEARDSKKSSGIRGRQWMTAKDLYSKKQKKY